METQTEKQQLWGIWLTPNSDKTTLLRTLNLKKVAYSLCSKQQLLQPYLTIRENLQVLGILYRVPNSILVINKLIQWANLQDIADQKYLCYLPYDTMLLTNLLGALLPAPKLLVIDDFTSGLSLLAQKRLWQRLLQLPQPKPSQIIYISTDMAVFNFLKFEQVWTEQSNHLWVSAIHPRPVLQESRNQFTFEQTKYAQLFLRCLAETGISIKAIDSLNVLATVSYEEVIHFNIGIQWTNMKHIKDTYKMVWADTAGITLEQFIKLWHLSPRPGLTWPQQQTVIWWLAWQEWLYHFRTFWKATNLFFFNLFLLIFMVVIQKLEVQEHITADKNWFMTLHILLSLVGCCWLWVIKALTRFSTLVNLNSPLFSQQPFSKLLLTDSIGLGRLTAFLGLWGGQTLIFISHIGLITLFVLGGYFLWLAPSDLNLILPIINLGLLWQFVYLFLFPLTTLWRWWIQQN